MTAEDAAKIGYSETMRGKNIVVPGFLNRVFVTASRIIPASLFTSTPFSGQFDLLATGSFDTPQELFSPDSFSRLAVNLVSLNSLERSSSRPGRRFVEQKLDTSTTLRQWRYHPACPPNYR